MVGYAVLLAATFGTLTRGGGLALLDREPATG